MLGRVTLFLALMTNMLSIALRSRSFAKSTRSSSLFFPRNTVLRSLSSMHEELPSNDDLALLKIRHSAAHVLAMAVQNVIADAKVATGPWTENGYSMPTN